VADYLQKTYDCILRFRGNINNSVPLFGITKHELQLLAFMHGVEALPPTDIRARGEKVIVDEMATAIREDGVVITVKNERDEFQRLARKYDLVVDTGRGKKAVEECFRVRLDGFDNIIEEVNPLDAMEKAAADAEAKAALALGGSGHERVKEEMKSGEIIPPVGSRVFSSANAQ
jgi:hypothetical protein